jgi:hypothetical protein
VRKVPAVGAVVAVPPAAIIPPKPIASATAKRVAAARPPAMAKAAKGGTALATKRVVPRTGRA